MLNELCVRRQNRMRRLDRERSCGTLSKDFGIQQPMIIVQRSSPPYAYTGYILYTIFYIVHPNNHHGSEQETRYIWLWDDRIESICVFVCSIDPIIRTLGKYEMRRGSAPCGAEINHTKSKNRMNIIEKTTQQMGNNHKSIIEQALEKWRTRSMRAFDENLWWWWRRGGGGFSGWDAHPLYCLLRFSIILGTCCAGY